jgi:uncharacterized protein
MNNPTRRDAMLILGTGAAAVAAPAWAAGETLAFLTAGPGSAFLPYGRGIASIVNAGGAVTLEVKETKGSIENLAGVEASAASIGTAFLGSAHEAINGIGPFAGKPCGNLRAIAPMYETAFHIAAPTAGGISTVRGLDGRRIGVGPAGGPAEAFFKGLVEVAGLKLTIVNGTPAELTKAYADRTIDAFWQGASLPIPALVQAAKDVESVVFGLTDNEAAAMLKRFPYLALSSTAPGTYQGQAAIITSVAAWNIIVAHKDLPEPVAYALTRAILGHPDIVAAAGPAAAGTRAPNAPLNRTVPYHAGAARYLGEVGVKVSAG